MAGITANFLETRANYSRYKAFLFAGIILLIIAGSAVGGFFLFKKYEDPAVAGAGNEQTNSGKLPRQWLLKYFGTDKEYDAKVGGLYGDPDEDILTNEQEFYFSTNPANPDSDGDGQYDGAEVAANSNPTGEGELYSTEYARKVAEKFYEYNDLEEFKKENIQSQILGILNPPDPAKMEVQLPDPKTLKLGKDNTPEAVDQYFKTISEKSGSIDISGEVIAEALENSTNPAVVTTPQSVYETINNLREISVPPDLLKFHQLHIAGLFAAASVFEIAKGINPEVELDVQKDKLQEQYYHVSVIQKIDQMLKEETAALKIKYKDIIEKYESAMPKVNNL